MSDDPGVLGNLPRSRPGRRSEKRGSGGAWSEAAGAAGSSGGASAPPQKQARARPASGTRQRAGTAPRQPRPRRPVQEQPPPGDPLSGAVRAAGGLAEAGVKTAVKVAGGVLKRLPRP